MQFQTSLNRRWSCAPYKPKSVQFTSQSLKLVKDATLEVDGICLNEFSRHDAELRIGVSCRPRISEYASRQSEVKLDDDPLSKRLPKLKRTRIWWFSYIDVEQQCNMQVCFAPNATTSLCSGLLFRNHDGVQVSVGQWRVDGEINVIRADQFSSFVFINRFVDGKHVVILSSHSRSTTVTNNEVEINGRLEWWAGSGGNYIISFKQNAK